MNLRFLACICLLSLCTACGGETFVQKQDDNAPLVGVVIDNHENARAHQRGLEKAVFIQEQFVEGFITRFLAVFRVDDLPESIGPIRSIRPYFVDGTFPLLSGLFHVGGSPEGLEKLQDLRVLSFNALSGYDQQFSYDAAAPAPHNRFLTADSALRMLSEAPSSSLSVSDLFLRGDTTASELATQIEINYRSPLHNVSYMYDEASGTYAKRSGGVARFPSPVNILMLQTEVEVVGPLGRLAVEMQGTGPFFLFRDGMVEKGRWTKEENGWFAFSRFDGSPITFANGQVWMIVLDDLSRVKWVGE